MLLTRAVVRGIPSALKMVKSLIDNPMIVSTTPPWAISLEVESYSKTGSADVSQRPVIVPGTGVKQFLNDNVAPGPLEWHLSGYIPGDDLIEQTCAFTPIVHGNTELLWLAYKLGSRIMFKDTDQVPYLNCVISNLETNYTKECKNKMPFSMTIQEINTIEASVANLTEAEKNALPVGEDESEGAVSTTSVGNSTLKSAYLWGKSKLGG